MKEQAQELGGGTPQPEQLVCRELLTPRPPPWSSFVLKAAMKQLLAACERREHREAQVWFAGLSGFFGDLCLRLNPKFK